MHKIVIELLLRYYHLCLEDHLYGNLFGIMLLEICFHCFIILIMMYALVLILMLTSSCELVLNIYGFGLTIVLTDVLHIFEEIIQDLPLS